MDKKSKLKKLKPDSFLTSKDLIRSNITNELTRELLDTYIVCENVERLKNDSK